MKESEGTGFLSMETKAMDLSHMRNSQPEVVVLFYRLFDYAAKLCVRLKHSGDTSPELIHAVHELEEHALALIFGLSRVALSRNEV